MSKATISLKNVWFRYPGVKKFLLKSLTWDKPEPGVVGLLGTNGCGKTTLLKLIAGILKPIQGTVQINHKAVKGINYTKNIITFVPENAKLFLIGPTPRKDLYRIINDQKIVEELFNQYGFKELADKKLYHLSEGQRRLIAYFIAFQLPSNILIFDEPTIGLDAKGRQIFSKLLDQAVQQGKISLISSNDPRIFSLLEEIIVIHERTLFLQGSPKEVLYRLEEETELIPNQIVRLIRSLELDLDRKFPHYLKVEELNNSLDARRLI
ncbi:MAG: ATP-binding cassette domain-containing protein [Candidatus Hermodarchaeota archaeon]